MNHLYFGDCLDILKQLHHKNKTGFIDLIYIDPPFNSKRNYNVLFESIDLKDATAQKQAFADTWSNVSYIDTINEIADLDKDLHTFLKTLSNLRVSDSAVAYLSTMAIRIHYMHKVLKDTGSFYLHCDPTMSHYLKVICDLIFGEKNFQNEIIWKRAISTGSSKSISKKFSSDADILLYYTKTSKFTFNMPFKKYGESYLSRFKFKDKKGEYRWQSLSTYSEETVKELEQKKEIRWNSNGNAEYKQYKQKLKGVAMNNIWDDINVINPMSNERLGYPTQKPQALLERIIQASSNEGDLIADFFCGCGTTVAAAQLLKRNWLGVDISHLAVRLIAKRLVDTYGFEIKHQFKLDGFPQDIGSAKELAQNTDKGRFNFQEWVIEVLLNGVVNIKKVADGGYDGYLTFNISETQKEFVLIEVKSGNVNVKNIREFIHVIEKQKAAIGIFVCFEEQVTQPMLKEIKQAGKYQYTGTGYQSDFEKIQICTVEDLMKNHMPKIPESTKTTFKSAKKSKNDDTASFGLFD